MALEQQLELNNTLLADNTAAIRELINLLSSKTVELSAPTVSVEVKAEATKKQKPVLTQVTSAAVDPTPTVERDPVLESPSKGELQPASNQPDYEFTAKLVTEVSVKKGMSIARGVLSKFNAKSLKDVSESEFSAVVEACQLALAA